MHSNEYYTRHKDNINITQAGVNYFAPKCFNKLPAHIRDLCISAFKDNKMI